SQTFRRARAPPENRAAALLRRNRRALSAASRRNIRCPRLRATASPRTSQGSCSRARTAPPFSLSDRAGIAAPVLLCGPCDLPAPGPRNPDTREAVPFHSAVRESAESADGYPAPAPSREPSLHGTPADGYRGRRDTSSTPRNSATAA